MLLNIMGSLFIENNYERWHKGLAYKPRLKEEVILLFSRNNDTTQAHNHAESDQQILNAMD